MSSANTASVDISEVIAAQNFMSILQGLERMHRREGDEESSTTQSVILVDADTWAADGYASVMSLGTVNS